MVLPQGDSRAVFEAFQVYVSVPVPVSSSVFRTHPDNIANFAREAFRASLTRPLPINAAKTDTVSSPRQIIDLFRLN